MSGFAVVRVKTAWRGRGRRRASCSRGWRSAGNLSLKDGCRVSVETSKGRTRVFEYPHHIVDPQEGQHDLYETLMPSRIEAFLSGINVNIMCYGQTGSGKTHTMFGPPGLITKASRGHFGMNVAENYGLCPRGIINIMKRVKDMEQENSSMRYFLTASAVEVTFLQGNRDMLRSKQKQCAPTKKGWQSSTDVQLSKTSKPPMLWGQREIELASLDSLLELFRGIASRSTKGTKG